MEAARTCGQRAADLLATIHHDATAAMRAADVRAEEMDTAPPTRGGNGDAGKKYVEEALYLRLFRRGSTPRAVRLQLGGRRLHPPATAPGALPSGTQGGVTFRLGEPFQEKELAVQQAAKNPAPLAGSAACHGSASQVQMDGDLVLQYLTTSANLAKRSLLL